MRLSLADAAEIFVEAHLVGRTFGGGAADAPLADHRRAVAALPVLCEYCLPLVRVGGVFIAMKGPDADAELGGSAAALKKLGGAYGDTRAFTLPDGSERRLVVCKKISQTPTAYPRNGGKIAKKPL